MQRNRFGRRFVATLALLCGATTLALAAPATAAPPDGTVTLISPINNQSVPANPVLSWEPLDDVAKYRVQISDTAAFATLLWNKDVLNVSATPDVELPVKALHWRVAPMNGKEVGAYSTGQFTRSLGAGPTLTSPADGHNLEYPDEPVVLRWNAVSGVQTYKVEVDDGPDFIGATAHTTQATALTLDEPQAIGQPYYWRVQGLGTGSVANTEPSESRSYSLSWGPDGAALRPVLTSPADGATVQDVALRWNAVPGAATYQVQISPNRDWANNLTIDQNVKGTSYSPPPAKSLPNGSYYWRVQAIDTKTGTPNKGAWSSENWFNRTWADAPALEWPEDQATAVDDLLLRWTPVPFASAYEVYVGTNPNFSPGSYATCFTTHSDWSPYSYETAPVNYTPPSAATPGSCALRSTQNLRDFTPAGERLHWKVRGIDQPAAASPVLYGPFSATRSFIYLPGRPTTTFAGGQVAEPVLSWTEVPRAEKYRVQISRLKNGSTSILGTYTTYATSYVPYLTYDADVTHYAWRVWAVDVDGREYPAVTGPTFTLTAGEAGGGSMTPVAPANGASTVANPRFDWTPLTGATVYRVRLYLPGTGIYTDLHDTNRNPADNDAYAGRSTFTPTGILTPGAFEWSVVAYGPLGIMAETPRRSITIEDPELVTPIAPANCTEGSNSLSCPPEQASPLLQWQPVPEAGFYRVHIAADANFTTVKKVYRTTQTSLRPTEALLDSQAGQAYYWFVQPCQGYLTSTTPQCGRYDPEALQTAWAFKKVSRPIELLTPASGAVEKGVPTFSWKAPSADWNAADGNDDVEARTYRIQVSSVPDFATLVDNQEVEQTTYTPYGLTYPEGPLYWRVQARDGSGNWLTMSPGEGDSQGRLLTKRADQLGIVAPQDGGTVFGLPVLHWEPQAFAASYVVEVYKNGDKTWTINNRVVNKTTKLSAYAPVDALPLGEYAWRVRRNDADGRHGPWIAGRTFVIEGGRPELTNPAEGAVFVRDRIRLEWTPVDQAVTYQVQTSASPGFGSFIEDVKSTPMLAWSPQAATYPNGTIYWRVIAKDAKGSALGTSEVGTYVHDVSRPTAAITAVTAGPASARLTWTATPVRVGPITSFRIRAYVGSTTTVEKNLVVNGSLRAFTMTGLANDRTYRFTVTPVDAHGEGTESPKSGNVTPREVLPFTSVDRFVDRQFRDFFGRPPTSTELSTWRTRIQGSTTPEGMIQALYVDPAHDGVVPAVTRLYAAFLGRTPDYGGTMYWVRKRRAGAKLDVVANFFASSNEFKTKYGNLTNRGYIEMVYRDVLDRGGDAGGIAYWTRQLDLKRRNRGQIMVNFSESSEYKGKFFARTTATVLYMDMLLRRPTDDQLAALSEVIQGAIVIREDGTKDYNPAIQAGVRTMLGMEAYAARAT